MLNPKYADGGGAKGAFNVFAFTLSYFTLKIFWDINLEEFFRNTIF